MEEALSPGEQPTGPLSGIRIVDLTSTFMGPYCTLHLARLGADVVKVESVEGDALRAIMDFEGLGLGPIFLGANHGKRSVAVDLACDDGRDLLIRLVRTADVFITSMRSKALTKLSITDDDIHAQNPTCIHVQLVGFGPGGRYANQPAYDDVIQAVCGLADTQRDETGPHYVKSAVADKTVGVLAFGAVMTALYARQRTGKGCAVTVPMFEAMAGFTLMDQQAAQTFVPPKGPARYLRQKSPYRRPYRTQDGYLGVMIYTDRMWHSFFTIIGRPELNDDPRFSTLTSRTTYTDDLYAIVESEISTRSSEYWLRELGAVGIPVAPVNTIEQLMDDPHLSDVDYFDEVDHPMQAHLRLPSFPCTFSGYPRLHLRPAPSLGEHSREIAAEMGYTPDDIDELVRTGVLHVGGAGAMRSTS